MSRGLGSLGLGASARVGLRHQHIGIVFVIAGAESTSPRLWILPSTPDTCFTVMEIIYATFTRLMEWLCKERFSQGLASYTPAPNF
jgi:hypothetical protein